jgi:hypothetical protein
MMVAHHGYAPVRWDDSGRSNNDGESRAALVVPKEALNLSHDSPETDSGDGGDAID